MTSAFNEFEAVLKAELDKAAIFFVSPKYAMDMSTLIESGEQAFPKDLGEKIPEAVEDARQAMSCIAYELPTAAAFHLHRVNETVLKHYWKSISGRTELPSPNATMGQILNAMEKDLLGREEIRSSLRDIIKLHRNPTIHPEQSLDDVEDAVNLYGAIRSIVGFMLKKIPSPT